jgi:hypothetical protein
MNRQQNAVHCIVSSVIVNNFNFFGASVRPNETNAPLIVDAIECWPERFPLKASDDFRAESEGRPTLWRIRSSLICGLPDGRGL